MVLPPFRIHSGRETHPYIEPRVGKLALVAWKGRMRRLAGGVFSIRNTEAYSQRANVGWASDLGAYPTNQAPCALQGTLEHRSVTGPRLREYRLIYPTLMMRCFPHRLAHRRMYELDSPHRPRPYQSLREQSRALERNAGHYSPLYSPGALGRYGWRVIHPRCRFQSQVVLNRE